MSFNHKYFINIGIADALAQNVLEHDLKQYHIHTTVYLFKYPYGIHNIIVAHAGWQHPPA